MKSVVWTATVVAGMWLGLPGSAAAQDPKPSPAEARREQPGERAGAARAIARPVPADQTPQDAERGDVQAIPRAEASRLREVRANRIDLATAHEEEQRGSGRRGGAVRRPPSDGGRTAGGPGGRDRAVPRTSARRPADRVVVYPNDRNNYRYYRYDPWLYSGFGLGYLYYSPWGWAPGYYDPGYYGSYAARGYRGSGYDIGSVRLKVKPRDAEVYVDNYFAGYVDDFDGIFQSLKLDTGGYRIEIRKPGFETLHFDVRVQPDRSVTFRGEMKPVP